MPSSSNLSAVERSLEAGVDPSRDIGFPGCRCGNDGHRLLRLAYGRQRISGPQAAALSNEDMTIARGTLARLRNDGLIYLLIGREGGWPAGWWSVQATPAGLRHGGLIDGLDDRHGGSCGGTWDATGRCGICGTLRPLTIELARRRLAAMPQGSERAQEAWASQFVCPYHGRARVATVRTDKCCTLCRELLIRRSALE